MATFLPDDTLGSPNKLRRRAKLFVDNPPPEATASAVPTPEPDRRPSSPTPEQAAAAAAGYSVPFHGFHQALNLSHRLQGAVQGRHDLMQIGDRTFFPNWNPTARDLDQMGVLKRDHPKTDPAQGASVASPATSVAGGAHSKTAAPAAAPTAALNAKKLTFNPTTQQLAADGALKRPSLSPVQQVGPDGQPVSVFSDGSNGIARTLTPSQITDAGQQLNTVPASAFSRPLASDVYGHDVSSSEMANNLIRGAQGPMFDNTSPAWQRKLDQSRADDIASGDIRSREGTIANNLRVDANSGTPRERRIAENALTRYQRGAEQTIQADTAQAGANARANVAGSSALQREQLRNQGGLERALLTRKPGAQVQLADGTLGVLGPNGTVQRATGANGQPVRLRVTKPSAAQQRMSKVLDDLAKSAGTLVKNSALSGQPLTAGAARLQAARLQGLQVASDKQGNKVVNVNGQWIPL